MDYVDCNCPDLNLDIDWQYGSPELYAEYDATINALPQINPNNSNEIVFISSPNNQDNSNLIVYDINTHEQRTIYSGHINRGRISWGKKDWILFQVVDGGVFPLYKIKSSGDSLTPIGNGQWFFPSWNTSGDKFVVSHKYKSPAEPRTFILDENGIVLDSFASDKLYHDGSGDWSHPEYYLRYTAKTIYLMDLMNNTVIRTINAATINEEGNQTGGFTRVGWLSYDKLVFYVADGLYTYDLIANKVTHVRCKCGFVVLNFSHSFDFSSVIMGVFEIRLIENNQKYFYDRRMFLFDPITLEEEELLP